MTTVLVPTVLIGLALAVMWAVSNLAERKKRRKAAAPASPSDAARILIHSINDDRCTGCDACVAVCPTNVLDLIDNKSRVLRFGDCIQCEQCMWACPTEALVMHLEHTEPPKLTLAELDRNYMTNVDGLYLIGEVAGKPLVKNAANIGRGVVEHMLANGLQGTPARQNEVDVVIVGSGPGGLSAALSCINRGLSYVVLEKEQIVASTVARYPKGKLVMAEPYDCRNFSLLPVFDSSKEELVPIWEDVVQQVGMDIRRGEAVEAVERQSDGTFEVRSTVAQYRARRVVLATGLRGKPRTLGVQGENLPKVFSLLEDPDEHAGKAALVVGGGDSAIEAALALADSGAQVILSYRGRAFSRAAAKNKQQVAEYAAQKRIKVKFQSNVAEFAEDTVTLQLADGTYKRYANHAAFVLIGADPPVKWLTSLGINFVERPHSFQLGPTDGFVGNFLGGMVKDAPEDAASAAALVLGREAPAQPSKPRRQSAHNTQGPQGVKIIESGRKWIASASSIFTSAPRKVDAPMSLSEFAKRGSTHGHKGRGRRDALRPEERTRVLRMLRDDGARLADEESSVYLNDNAPSRAVSEMRNVPAVKFDDSPAPMHLGPDGLSGPVPLAARAPQPAPARRSGPHTIKRQPAPQPEPPRPAPSPGAYMQTRRAHNGHNGHAAPSARSGHQGHNGLTTRDARNGRNGQAAYNGHSGHDGRRGPAAPPAPAQGSRPQPRGTSGRPRSESPKPALIVGLASANQRGKRPTSPPRFNFAAGASEFGGEATRTMDPDAAERLVSQARPEPDFGGLDEATRAAGFDAAALMAQAGGGPAPGHGHGNGNGRDTSYDEPTRAAGAMRGFTDYPDVHDEKTRAMDINSAQLLGNSQVTRQVDIRSLSDIDWDIDE